MNPSQPAPRPKWPWITLIVLQGIQALTLFPWLLIAGLSFMAFDAPGSQHQWQPWAFVLAVWSYPLWLFAAGAASWTLFVFRRYVFAVGLAAIFALPGPLLLGVIAFVR